MNKPSKKAPPEEHEAWAKYRSCTKKKVFTKSEADEVLSRKPWYRSYKCEHCHKYHLTKVRFFRNEVIAHNKATGQEYVAVELCLVDSEEMFLVMDWQKQIDFIKRENLEWLEDKSVFKEIWDIIEAGLVTPIYENIDPSTVKLMKAIKLTSKGKKALGRP